MIKKIGKKILSLATIMWIVGLAIFYLIVGLILKKVGGNKNE